MLSRFTLPRSFLAFRLAFKASATSCQQSRKSFATSSNTKMDKRLTWIDCEMSGLDINKDRLLEIALVITDHNLNKLDTFQSVFISTPDVVLNSMSEWCTRQFTANGLTEACRRSTVTIEQVDSMLQAFMKNNNVTEGVLAGNSLTLDRQFVNKYCPKFVSCLHYRMVDVSSIKVLVNLWTDDKTKLNKKTRHRAMDDIEDSIEELKYYRNNYFKC